MSVPLFLLFCETATRLYGFKKRRDGATFCNEFVQMVGLFFGCRDLVGKLANEQVSMMTCSESWSEVPAVEAQNRANAGKLVIAGFQTAPAGRGGHVAVVIPGKMEFSGNHGPVPVVANVGASNFFNKHAGHAFSKDRPPRYFVWQSPIEGQS